jgi:hypothetical protein
MTNYDSESERRRLTDFYSRQMDGELEKVARQADELTPVAREVLRNELIKRGLDTELLERLPAAPVPAPQPTKPKPPPAKMPAADLPAWLDADLPLRELITLRKFRDLPEALLAKGCLELAGIESCLVDDNMVRLDWFWSNLMGGIKLKVRPEDTDAANSILDQPIPEGFEVAGVGEYEQPQCPNCRSLDVNFRELDRPVAYVRAYFNVPVPLRRRAWRCHACRTEWEDDGVDDGTGGARS